MKHGLTLDHNESFRMDSISNPSTYIAQSSSRQVMRILRLFSGPQIITARNSSCGKVMFLQVSVCPQEGDVSQHVMGQRGVYPSM